MLSMLTTKLVKSKSVEIYADRIIFHYVKDLCTFNSNLTPNTLFNSMTNKYKY